MKKEAFAERVEQQRGAGGRAKAPPPGPPTDVDNWKVEVKALRPVWISAT